MMSIIKMAMLFMRVAMVMISYQSFSIRRHLGKLNMMTINNDEDNDDFVSGTLVS